jgi:predicted nuclease of predicted toxin-antitoxin system
MKFYADENVPRRIVNRLRSDGHDVAHAVEKMRGWRDRTILQAALNQAALVLTLDKDYRRLTLEEHEPTLGVVWIRVAQLSRHEQTERVAQVIQAQGNLLLHHFTIIYPDRVEMLPLDIAPLPE